jgi:hypothetical protein
VTKADPDPQPAGRGRHARSEDAEDDAAPREAAAPPEDDAAPPEDDAPKRPFQPIGRHPAGVPLLIAAGLVTGLSLVPLLLDRLDWNVALDAAANASSAAAPWPTGADPWFAPGWVAETGFVMSAAVLVLALVGLKLPDVVVLVLAAVLTGTTAWAALATLDVLEAGLWELIPVGVLCVVAFGLAATATARWRSDPAHKGDEGATGVAAAALASWLAVAVVLLAGAAIADSARTALS